METKFRRVVLSKESVYVVRALRSDGEGGAGSRTKGEALQSLLPDVPFAPKVVKFVENVYDIGDTDVVGWRFNVLNVEWRKVQPKVVRSKPRRVKQPKVVVSRQVAQPVVRHIAAATLEELQVIRRRAVQWNF